jgi:short chain dehydrogenase
MKSESGALVEKDGNDAPGARELLGCNALVVGATGAAGFRAARVLGALGARLMLCARHAERLELAMQDLQALGIDTRWVAADGRMAADVDRLVQATLERMGDIDVLVTALPDAAVAARVADEVVRVSMGPQQRGSIVHLDASSMEPPGAPGLLDACVVRQAREWQGLGVRVNAVCGSAPLDADAAGESFDAAVRLFAGPSGRAFTGQSLALGGAWPPRQGA